MATIQVYDERSDTNYNIDYTVENAVVNQNHTGYPNYYIKVSTGQRVFGTGAIVPAEIVLNLLAPNYDVTEELKARSVVIMDKVSGGFLSSSSSTRSSSSSVSRSSESSLSSLSSLSSQTP